ncbi:MAG: DUF177 domain-containing protein [Acidobacteria bacterium]|nr:DUF177 domain-containing protein [Acidobacteriota bacterium]
MVIDITTLPVGRVPVAADIPPEALDVPAEDFVIKVPVHVMGELERGAGASVHLRGRVQAQLALPCARCAEPFDFAVDAPVDLRFVPVVEDAAPSRPQPAGRPVAAARGTSASTVTRISLDDEDEGGYEMQADDPSIVSIDEPRIDLAPVAREQCYLAMPMKPLCRPDCQGLCPQCGINRNVGMCTCETQWKDPRLAGLESLLKDADGAAPRE